jgi:hypothetical protein
LNNKQVLLITLQQTNNRTKAFTFDAYHQTIFDLAIGYLPIGEQGMKNLAPIAIYQGANFYQGANSGFTLLFLAAGKPSRQLRSGTHR